MEDNWRQRGMQGALVEGYISVVRKGEYAGRERLSRRHFFRGSVYGGPVGGGRNRGLFGADFFEEKKALYETLPLGGCGGGLGGVLVR